MSFWFWPIRGDFFEKSAESGEGSAVRSGWNGAHFIMGVSQTMGHPRRNFVIGLKFTQSAAVRLPSIDFGGEKPG